jgi:dihydrofolate reductase
MRKLVAVTQVTLDGVMQAPGGPEEDPTGGFEIGGWSVGYVDDYLGARIGLAMAQPFDLVLGRKTYEIFAGYWPDKSDPTADSLNKAHKYVASRKSMKPEWNNSTQLSGDAAGAVRKLKQQDGPDLQVHGSGDFIQTLLKNDLVDELWLKIFPVTLGEGKRLFGEGTSPAAFKVTKSTTSPSGVIVASFRRDGEVKTGTFVA